MEAVAQFAVLTLTTILTGALAAAMAWAFLRGAFHLMQPAAAHRPRVIHSELVHGTRASARQFVRG